MISRISDSTLAVLALTALLFFSTTVLGAAPSNFSQAKIVLKEQVYFDQNRNGASGTIYCGCDWDWVGRSGGRIDPSACGYKIRAIPERGKRTEVEHVYPASHFGKQRQCWQQGGRKNCNKNDPVFNLIEADLHNLSYAVGELNADRADYRFGELRNVPRQHGQCGSAVDFKQRVFSPRPEARGKVARINFYMSDRYNLRMSDQQQKLFLAWDKQYPVSDWELLRDHRIAKVMGHHNEFVTGERVWSFGHRNTGDGVVGANRKAAAKVSTQQTQQTFQRNNTASTKPDISGSPVHGNRNSKIFHPKGCSSYNAMSPRNVVNFDSEAEALNAGYRKAKNCR